MKKSLFKIITGLGKRELLNWMPDKTYIKIAYWTKFKKRIDLKEPKTFNEKLQWLKLNDRKEIYTKMVDKYEVKKYIKDIIGEEYVIPTIGIYDKFDEINFDKLPDKFVIKCTHDSGSVVVVKDKNKMDMNLIKRKVINGAKRNGFYYGREWQYKNVKPRIIIEECIPNEGDSLNDYKFFCFNGKVKCFKIDFNRFTKHQANYYDRETNLLEFGEKAFPFDLNKKITMPSNLQEMINLSEKIAKDFSFVRVDFYSNFGKIYFGEITLYPASGFGKFYPSEWDDKLGSWINIEN